MTALLIAATGLSEAAVVELQAAMEQMLPGYGKVLASDGPSTSSNLLGIWFTFTEFEPDDNHQGKLGHVLSMLPAPVKVFAVRKEDERDEFGEWIIKQPLSRPFITVSWNDGDIHHMEIYAEPPGLA